MDVAPEVPARTAEGAKVHVGRYRWRILALIFFATTINYVDRQAISVLVGQIRDGLHLSEHDYWQIITLFLIAYAIMYALSGYIIDKVGVKIGMTLFVCVCSMSIGRPGTVEVEACYHAL